MPREAALQCVSLAKRRAKRGGRLAPRGGQRRQTGWHQPGSPRQGGRAHNSPIQSVRGLLHQAAGQVPEARRGRGEKGRGPAAPSAAERAPVRTRAALTSAWVPRAGPGAGAGAGPRRARSMAPPAPRRGSPAEHAAAAPARAGQSRSPEPRADLKRRGPREAPGSHASPQRRARSSAVRLHSLTKPRWRCPCYRLSRGHHCVQPPKSGLSPSDAQRTPSPRVSERGWGHPEAEQRLNQGRAKHHCIQTI